MPLWWTLRRVRSTSNRARQAALLALGSSKSPKAIPPLLEALAEDVFVLRDAAETSLAELGSLAVEPLLDLLRRHQSCSSAVWILGRIGEPRAIPAILAAWRCGDVRFEVAAEALEALGWTSEDGAHLAVSAIRVRAVDRLEDMDRGVLFEHLVLALRSAGSSEHREWCAQELVRLGDRRAVEPLATAVLQHRLPRASGLAAVGALDPEWARGEAAPLVRDAALEQITRRKSGVQEIAATLLEAIGDEASVVGLKRALVDSDELRARLIALRAVVASGDPEIVPILAEVVETWIDATRTEALSALAPLGDTRAQSALLNALGSGSRDQQEIAAAGLRTLGTPESLEAVRVWEEHGFERTVVVFKVGTAPPNPEHFVLNLLATRFPGASVRAKAWRVVGVPSLPNDFDAKVLCSRLVSEGTLPREVAVLDPLEVSEGLGSDGKPYRAWFFASWSSD